MAAFTSKATGNWSASGQTSWNQVGVPASGDTVTISHAITVDVDTTIGIGGGAGVLAMTTVGPNGVVTVAAGKKFTLKGDVKQGDCAFNLGAGSELIFDTTGGNRKWLLGDGSVWHLDNVYFNVNGTAGSHAKIYKTGSNKYWFDGFDEGSGAFGSTDSSGYDVTYCDITDCGRDDGTTNAFSFRFNESNGYHHNRFKHCVFDNCSRIAGGWSRAQNKDFQHEYNQWTNSNIYSFFGTPIACLQVTVSGSGTGTTTINHCGFDGNLFSTLGGVSVNDNYFGQTPTLSGALMGSFLRNTVRQTVNGQTLSLLGGLVDTYFLADHIDPADPISGVSGVGNPHCISATDTGQVFDGVVLDYPHALLIDNGDGIFGGDFRPGPPGNFTITRCLVLPSISDGVSGTNLHGHGHGDDGVILTHNTAVGKMAQLAFNERTASDAGDMAQMKSNLVAGDSQSTTPNSWGAAFDDLHAIDDTASDIVTPSGIKNNYLHNPIIYTDPVSGLRHDGFRARLSSVPDGTNIIVVGGTGPAFFDRTRCAVTWAVYKGYVGADPGTAHTGLTWKTWKRAALDAVHAALLVTPTLGYADLLPWVKTGFAPTNPALNGAAHDGTTIGAVPFVSGGGGGGGTLGPKAHYYAQRR